MGERTKMAPATEAGPCAACPWRTENHGKRHPDGWYSNKNLRRLWAGLRTGERMTCHPTDPRNPVPDGHRAAPEGTTTRECYGAQVLIQRELQRVSDALTPDGAKWSDYSRSHPRGLTRDGAAAHISSHIAFPGELVVTHVDLNTTGISAPGVEPWEPRR